MADIDRILAAAPVIPVLVIDRVEDALPIARALVEGGLPVLEVTMRTPAALDAIRAMKEVEGAIVGAGTVLNPKQFDQAVEAGSEFIVSPGLTETLGRAVQDAPVPLLPGVATAGDIMRALDLGFTRLKFFPAMSSGGIPALKGFSAVFGGVRFCPTGGITLETAPDWLALKAVACVGGSWMVPAGSVDPDAIRERARKAAALRPSA
ncbi:bifunctional 4-hydroxy-2-oxoglutarate aldolase/2-dehydro-3-deoxy-phosphogluconate aldolase [Allosphingosinicella deserti]|uniref:2-dehydro-3-deoxyphosphogluconate aldolase n=1 Tax=Allosphingosinicella deserti TaxID=2116704 RepID=A0A2P7QYE7_9SPHN|nr:bifunctional 4-hydroxy-2-oxoglutarate aldolase/2-dehydro-3-deoxy-phosphogluconate aldolase [Sphingomonas deserti]PSJ42969.1 2-dehydro-3-deoxyphosphogluconate aldolase [Sphingomonas deserti]